LQVTGIREKIHLQLVWICCCRACAMGHTGICIRRRSQRPPLDTSARCPEVPDPGSVSTTPAVSDLEIQRFAVQRLTVLCVVPLICKFALTCELTTACTLLFCTGALLLYMHPTCTCGIPTRELCVSPLVLSSHQVQLGGQAVHTTSCTRLQGGLQYKRVCMKYTAVYVLQYRRHAVQRKYRSPAGHALLMMETT
jgi:hypothetical protein